MVSIAMILTLISPGVAGEKIVRGKAPRLWKVARVGMKFAFCETFLKDVGVQLSILFTSLFIYFDSCIYKESLKRDNYNPNCRGVMRHRSLAK